MVQELIVGLIVVAAAMYVLKKYLPKALRERLFGKVAAAGGCDSGCGSCKSGCDTPTTPSSQDERVIRLHSK